MHRIAAWRRLRKTVFQGRFPIASIELRVVSELSPQPEPIPVVGRGARIERDIEFDAALSDERRAILIFDRKSQSHQLGHFKAAVHRARCIRTSDLYHGLHSCLPFAQLRASGVHRREFTSQQ
jgi:hypothetical protein